MKFKWDFFLAHAGDDSEVAESLYELLQPHSRVFLDSRTIKLGEDWDTVLREAQEQARITVVIISPHTPKAYYQREEIAAAIQLARTSPGAHRVVPIFLSSDSGAPTDVPYGLRLKHGIHLNAQSTLADCARRLGNLLVDMRGRRQKKVTSPSPTPTSAVVTSKRYSETQRKAYAELWPEILKLFDLPARNAAQITFSDHRQGEAHHIELAEPGYDLVVTLDRVAPFLEPSHYERLRQIATDFCNYHVQRRFEYASNQCIDPDNWTPERGEAWKILYFDKRAEAEHILRQVLTSSS